PARGREKRDGVLMTTAGSTSSSTLRSWDPDSGGFRGIGRRAHGFLLGEAVQGAQAPDKIHRVDPDDGAPGEEIGDDAERLTVVRIVEGGNEDGAVGDVEVRIA